MERKYYGYIGASVLTLLFCSVVTYFQVQDKIQLVSIAGWVVGCFFIGKSVKKKTDIIYDKVKSEATKEDIFTCGLYIALLIAFAICGVVLFRGEGMICDAECERYLEETFFVYLLYYLLHIVFMLGGIAVVLGLGGIFLVALPVALLGQCLFGNKEVGILDGSYDFFYESLVYIVLFCCLSQLCGIADYFGFLNEIIGAIVNWF